MKTSKRFLMSLAVAVGLAVVVSGVRIVHAQRQPVPAGPSNTIYQVSVVSSFGTNFTDCFRFDTPGMGDLTIDGLGQPITYRHGQLDANSERFKAVSRSGQALSIMFFGEAVDALNQLNGEAVNEFGDTFVFTGMSNASCPTGASASPLNPYLNQSTSGTSSPR
jgi:hypothetical protein